MTILSGWKRKYRICMDANVRKLHDYLDCHEWHAAMDARGHIHYDDPFDVRWFKWECACGKIGKSAGLTAQVTALNDTYD
jgi:hypothetical protein